MFPTYLLYALEQQLLHYERCHDLGAFIHKVEGARFARDLYRIIA